MKPGKFDCDHLECKPCPMCGGRANVYRVHPEDYTISPEFQAGCHLCWLKTQYYSWPLEAQAAWNRRPASAEMVSILRGFVYHEVNISGPARVYVHRARAELAKLDQPDTETK